jgi:hypothetical protein
LTLISLERLEIEMLVQFDRHPDQSVKGESGASYSPFGDTLTLP